MLALKSDRRTLVRVVAALAGALLLFSPYVVGFAAFTPEAVSAFALGFLIFICNMSMAVDERRRPDMLNILLGSACVVAPALAGFPETASALWLHGFVGAVTVLMGAYALYALTEHRSSPGSAAEAA